MLESITAFAEKQPHITALIVVGSGAMGYTDELSDLDFVVGLDGDASMETVMADMAAFLKERAKPIYFKQAAQRRMQVYLTDHYLEIDIGYGDHAQAMAFRPHWQVLFDRSGTVEEKMRSSWAAISAAPKEERQARVAAECADIVWHNLMHAAVALARGQCWRAETELENVRGVLLKLLGLRYGLDMERGREADKLPETELARLQGTLATALTPDALWQSLHALAEAVYAELARYGEQAHMQVNYPQMIEYLDFCRAR